MTRVFVNIGLSLDGYMAPEGMAIESWQKPEYRLTGGRLGFIGPAFTFPDVLPATSGVTRVEDERRLQHNFKGWEIE